MFLLKKKKTQPISTKKKDGIIQRDTPVPCHMYKELWQLWKWLWFILHLYNGLLYLPSHIDYKEVHWKLCHYNNHILILL